MGTALINAAHHQPRTSLDPRDFKCYGTALVPSSAVLRHVPVQSNAVSWLAAASGGLAWRHLVAAVKYSSAQESAVARAFIN